MDNSSQLKAVLTVSPGAYRREKIFSQLMRVVFNGTEPVLTRKLPPRRLSFAKQVRKYFWRGETARQYILIRLLQGGDIKACGCNITQVHLIVCE